MTSQWAQYRLKSLASRLFSQLFIEMQIKENIKAPRHWLWAGNLPGTGEFPVQRASNAENVSIWWRHHGNPRIFIMLTLSSLAAQQVVITAPYHAASDSKVGIMMIQFSVWPVGYLYCLVGYSPFNTLRPRQNCRHFPDDIFKWIFLSENVWISIKISLKFVPKFPINNISALVQIMAWRQSGDTPSSEPMIDSLLMHIWVTRPQ